MDSICFSIEGLPQGKGRPRSAKGQKKPYTPRKTVAYEQRVRTAFLMAYFEANGEAMCGEGSLFGDEAVEATVTAFLPLAKRCSKVAERLANLGMVRPTKKPDIDNIEKAVFDALNRLAYNDDSQIVRTVSEKVYCRSGEEHVEVTLRPWREGDT